MVICELCGSANVETDEHCRVCGQALKKDAAAAVAVQVAAPVMHEAHSPQVVSVEHESHAGWPTTSPPRDLTQVEPAQKSLQMSAYGAQVESDAPPMLGGSAEVDQPMAESLPGSDVPSFMQSGNRTGGSVQEPVQLISANDLPEWLRQIADADAAKAEAEAQAQSAHTDAPATIVKKALPGETMVSNTTTNWLSKSTVEDDSPDHWDSTEIANANWGNPESAPQEQGQQEYPSIVPPTAFVPSSTEAYTTTKSKRKLSFNKSASSASSEKPFYRNQTFQLALLVLLVAILAFALLT